LIKPKKQKKNLNFDAENEQKLGKMDQETEKIEDQKKKLGSIENEQFYIENLRKEYTDNEKKMIEKKFLNFLINRIKKEKKNNY